VRWGLGAGGGGAVAAALLHVPAAGLVRAALRERTPGRAGAGACGGLRTPHTRTHTHMHTHTHTHTHTCTHTYTHREDGTVSSIARSCRSPESLLSQWLHHPGCGLVCAHVAGHGADIPEALLPLQQHDRLRPQDRPVSHQHNTSTTTTARSSAYRTTTPTRAHTTTGATPLRVTAPFPSRLVSTFPLTSAPTRPMRASVCA
jgi:hypothetical protein